MAMNRRKWVLVVCGVVVVAAVPLVVTLVRGRQDAADYQEQLRLARAEGLPTSNAEFAASIPPADPSENAALLYRTLKVQVADVQQVAAIDRDLLHSPNPKGLAEAKAFLDKHHANLEVVERASALPRCWFDRRWEGAATLFPELTTLRSVAKIVALRGSVAAHQGRVVEALQDATRLFAIARHAGEEPSLPSRFAGEHIYSLGLRQLANWAFTHPDQPQYREALSRAIDAFPAPNLQDEQRDLLVNFLTLVDLCATPKGRAELGLREEDVATGAEAIFPLLLSQSKSRIKMVRSARAYWAALDKPTKERKPLLKAAMRELEEALFAFPTAAKLHFLLASGIDPALDREESWASRRLQYRALARALEASPIPATILTDDLLSPYDGKPLTYEFDGKQIKIGVSGAGEFGPKPLKIPPDEVVR